DWLVLALLIAGYLLLFFSFYPSTYGIEDEIGFIGEAVIMSRGALSEEGAGLSGFEGIIERGGRHVPNRNPGRPLLTVPFLLLFGERSVFVSGAMIHACLALLFALTVCEFGASPLWGVLILFHPTLAIYSRTVMGDPPAALFLLASFFFLVRRQPQYLLAGICSGLAAVMRYQCGIVVPFVLLALWRRKEREKWTYLVGSAVIGLFIAAYNLYLYRALTNQPNGYFDFSSFVYHLLLYGGILSCIWPLAFWVPLFSKFGGHKKLVFAFCVPFFLLMCAWYFNDRQESWYGTMIVAPRLIIPCLAVWFVPYAVWLEQKLKLLRLPWLRLAATAGCAAMLVAVQFFIFNQHQRHLDRLQAAKVELINLVPAGSLVIAEGALPKMF
ncbi:MAG TPA: hypothetical protein PLP17_16280, partial [Oligoflexia bacterium]|nr:hypothetical protein [Oligoflexia bacterium]